VSMQPGRSAPGSKHVQSMHSTRCVRAHSAPSMAGCPASRTLVAPALRCRLFERDIRSECAAQQLLLWQMLRRLRADSVAAGTIRSATAVEICGGGTGVCPGTPAPFLRWRSPGSRTRRAVVLRAGRVALVVSTYSGVECRIDHVLTMCTTH
jgi:hypothetical protein